MTTGETLQIGGELLSSGVKRLLLDRILAGHYQPGERIVELKLAKELGTSQSPIREALRDLAGIGVVEIHSRRGASVRLPTGKELADVSLVRSEIDALAARIAAPKISDEILADLQQALDAMFRAIAGGDTYGLTRADAQFHRMIATAADNRAVERVFNQLEPVARTFFTLTAPDVDLELIMREHQGILSALRSRNPELASCRARMHQLGVGRLFQQSTHKLNDVESAT